MTVRPHDDVAEVRNLIAELTGCIVREAARRDMAVPACRTVYRQVKGLEHARARRPAV